MHVVGRKKGDLLKFPVKPTALSSLSHYHPTECRMVISIYKARPRVGISAAGFSTSSDTVIQDVSELELSGMKKASRNDRRSRVLTQPDQQDDEKADNNQAGCPPPLSHSPWSLLCREHSPGKSVISIIINCSILYNEYWKRYLNMHF